jgi:hypothetical protein
LTGGHPGAAVGTPPDLQASASRRTGLTDFGDDDYADGLAVLLQACEREAALTAPGAKALRSFLRGALIARLFSQAAWTAHPHYTAVPVDRPIFITGLPRTGTTALHRLLTADPASQGLEMWLTQVPQPRPPREAWADDPVFQLLQAGFAQHHDEHPEFMGVHYMAAEQVEECWQLLQQSFRSVSFGTLAFIPSYSAWLSEQDWTGAYRRHRRNLQLIGLNDSDRRWVLKNPSHLFALDALLAVYPDALVIQTHRDPRTAIASACSLAAHASAGWSPLFSGPVIGATQLDLWASGLALFRQARARHAAGDGASVPGNTARFYDVQYDDLVADPMGTVEGIYGHLGLSLTGAAADAMRSLAATSVTGAKPAHRYALDEYGLTGAEVDERFAARTG